MILRMFGVKCDICGAVGRVSRSRLNALRGELISKGWKVEIDRQECPDCVGPKTEVPFEVLPIPVAEEESPDAHCTTKEALGEA